MAIETDECIRWPFATRHGGYGVMYWDGQQRTVHTAACEIANGPRPQGMQAAHNCGVPACFNRRHLRWATPKQNMADHLIHGTSNRGGRHGLAKLTEHDVRTIRQLDGVISQREIGRRFGVSGKYVAEIVQRKTWAWLDPDRERTTERIVLRGESHSRSKLTVDLVRQIRALLATMTHAEIAERLGIKKSAVASVAQRRVWAWLD
jgi:hypothetical protein